MFSKIKRIRNKVNKTADVAKEQLHLSKFYVWRRFILLAIFCLPKPDWFGNQRRYLYTLKYNRKFISWRFSEKIYAKFNPDFNERHILDDKILFNDLVHKYVHRDYLYLKNASLEDVKSFYSKHRKIIVKPLDGTCGNGIFSPSKIDQINDLIGKEYIAEEFVINHPSIAKFSNNSLNTVRFYSVRESDGIERIKAAVLRIGAKNNVVDNAAMGGEMVPVEINTGIIKNSAIDDNGKVNEINYNCGEYYVGQKLPFWEEAKETVLMCHKLFMNTRFIGWDVAITPTGVEIIEGNSRPHVHLLELSCGPSKKYFKDNWELVVKK